MKQLSQVAKRENLQLHTEDSTHNDGREPHSNSQHNARIEAITQIATEKKSLKYEVAGKHYKGVCAQEAAVKNGEKVLCLFLVKK